LEQILEKIIDDYSRLLKLYEKLYDKLKDASSANIIEVLHGTRYYISSISHIQKEIENLLKQIAPGMNNNLLIDSMLNNYSKGRIGEISSRIESIIESLNSYRETGINELKTEMKKLQLSIDSYKNPEKITSLLN
jgi:hypothetical protein